MIKIKKKEPRIRGVKGSADKIFAKPLTLYNLSAFHLNPGPLESYRITNSIGGDPNLIKLIDVYFFSAARTPGQIINAFSLRFENYLAVHIWKQILDPYSASATTKPLLHLTPPCVYLYALLFIYMNHKGKKNLPEFPADPDYLSDNAYAIYFAALKVNRRIVLVVTKQDKLIGVFLHPFDHYRIINTNSVYGTC